MVGSSIHRQLTHYKEVTVITASRSELDLTSQADVSAFFASQKIDQIYLAAAKVDGTLISLESVKILKVLIRQLATVMQCLAPV